MRRPRAARRRPWRPTFALAALLAACSPGAAPDAGGDAADEGADARVSRTDVFQGCVRTNGDGGADAGDAAALACNGVAALCDRRYDQVSYPTAHNAMSSADDRWTAPNQNHGISRALADGVRGLMLDAHYWEGRAGTFLCHGFCGLGSRPLAEGVCDVTRFLDAHPAEVVTIIFESYVTPADMASAFALGGADGHAYTHPPGAPWPTLRALIAGGRRLVVFTDNNGGGGAPGWYMPLWDHAWETHYAYRTASDFSCAINRGSAANPLFVLNHFITNPLADVSYAEMVNRDPLFIDRARRCQTESGGRLPNFPTVDFYDVGDLFAVTRALNGL